MTKTKVIIILLMIILGVTGAILSNNEEKSEVSSELDNSLKTKIVLYFSKPENGELTKEYRYVELSSIKENLERTIIDELLKGPSSEELVSAIPNGTKVNSINKIDDKIEIDFSKEYNEGSEDELQKLHKIYSVVSSLTEITEINEVEIKVEGKTITNKVRL